MGLVGRLYAGRVSLGDRLGEAFYAVWMAVISIGILNSAHHITPDFILEVVGIAFSVNIAWGLIDGITVMFTNIIDRANRDRLLYALRTAGGPAALQEAREDIGDSIAAGLPEDARERIVAAIAAGAPGQDPANHRYWPDSDDRLYALGIFLIDVALVVPVVAPLLIVSDVETAIYVSRLIATLIFAGLGWSYARQLNHNPWIAACGLGAFGFLVFTHAFQNGW